MARAPGQPLRTRQCDPWSFMGKQSAHVHRKCQLSRTTAGWFYGFAGLAAIGDWRAGRTECGCRPALAANTRGSLKSVVDAAVQPGWSAPSPSQCGFATAIELPSVRIGHMHRHALIDRHFSRPSALDGSINSCFDDQRRSLTDHPCNGTTGIPVRREMRALWDTSIDGQLRPGQILLSAVDLFSDARRRNPACEEVERVLRR